MMDNRLLIIDDDPEVGEFVGRVAKLSGYETAVTPCADEFRKLVASWEPSHIVLDLMVPEVDGIELFRFLAEANCRAQIILLSGADQGLLDAAKRLGLARGLDIVTSLGKPVRARDLREVLNRFKTRTDWLTERELERAIERKELFLVFQPKIALKTRQIAGFEALMRWQHPDRGLIAPSEFIPFAEEMDLMDRVTAAALKAGLAQLRIWHDQGIDPELAVNISGQDLHNVGFADDVLGVCRDFDVRPDRLTLELTETAVTRDAVNAMDILTRLRLRGVKLSIDDFGTGHSSLIQLQRLPFSEIKIDRAFIVECGKSENATIIVKTVIDMAHNLRMHTVAEGVENESVLATLSQMGCDMVQGFCISRPLEPDAVSRWMKTWVAEKKDLILDTTASREIPTANGAETQEQVRV